MLGILLLILKIAGWILLGLICLFFGVLLLVLLVPVPYRFSVQFGEGFTYRLCIFGLQVLPKKETGRKRKRRVKKASEKRSADSGPGTEVEKGPRCVESDGGTDAPPPRGEPVPEKPPDGREDTVAGEQAGLPGSDAEKEVPGLPGKDGAGEKAPEASKKGAGKKARKPSGEGAADGTSGLPGNEDASKKEPETSGEKGGARRAKKKRGREKQKPEKKKRDARGVDVDALREKWALFRAEFTDEGNRRALTHGFSEAAYLLRHFGPRRVKADIAYSLKDPANTGFATAALSLCPFAYQKGCRIIPDFESEALYAKGWADVRGHVRLVHCGVSGVRLLVDKDIRAIIRKIRRQRL